MYDRYNTVLLDVDADFMWNKECGWWNDSRAHRDTGNVQPQITGRQFGRALRRFKKKGTRLYLIVDHHESLFWWDKLNVRNALCIHIDGHHDMWENELPDQVGHRAEVDCGCYLNQALHDRIVSRVVYVPADFRTVQEQREDLQWEIPQQVGCKVTVKSWKTFARNKHLMPRADIITIAISPEWTPKYLWPEVNALCEQLRVPTKVIKSKKTAADKKWTQLHRYGDCDSFAFPYNARIV